MVRRLVVTATSLVILTTASLVSLSEGAAVADQSAGKNVTVGSKWTLSFSSFCPVKEVFASGGKLTFFINPGSHDRQSGKYEGGGATISEKSTGVPKGLVSFTGTYSSATQEYSGVATSSGQTYAATLAKGVVKGCPTTVSLP